MRLLVVSPCGVDGAFAAGFQGRAAADDSPVMNHQFAVCMAACSRVTPTACSTATLQPLAPTHLSAPAPHVRACCCMLCHAQLCCKHACCAPASGRLLSCAEWYVHSLHHLPASLTHPALAHPSASCCACSNVHLLLQTSSSVCARRSLRGARPGAGTGREPSWLLLLCSALQWQAMCCMRATQGGWPAWC